MKLKIISILFGGLFASGAAHAENIQTAIFAGGCFWCVESDYDKVSGVLETTSGYTGGTTENPTYKQVSGKETGHYEAVKITFDADIVGYYKLLHIFWRTVDPLDEGGQFCDRGSSYRAAVFAGNTEQATLAKDSRNTASQALGQDISTPILEARTFWPAEEYHQNYHNKNPIRYNFYRKSCGRDRRVKQLWGSEAGVEANS